MMGAPYQSQSGRGNSTPVQPGHIQYGLTGALTVLYVGGCAFAGPGLQPDCLQPNCRSRLVTLLSQILLTAHRFAYFIPDC
jgi:hypothetical protein